MSNTLTNVTPSMIADTFIPALRLSLLPINAISTEIREEPLDQGDIVKVPLMGARTATTYSTTYETGDSVVTSTSCTVTNAMASWYLSPAEANYNPGRFLAQGVDATKSVGYAVIQALIELYTEANVGSGASYEIDTSAANFDSDDVADALALANALGVQEAELVLLPAYYGALRKDNALHYADAYGSNVLITTGKVPTVHGCPVHQMAAMATTPTSENTTGLLIPKQSAAIVLSPFGGKFPDLENAAGVRTEQIVDEESGISLTYRQWINSASGFVWGSVVVSYGVGYGQDGAIRIATA